MSCAIIIRLVRLICEFATWKFVLYTYKEQKTALTLLWESFCQIYHICIIIAIIFRFFCLQYFSQFHSEMSSHKWMILSNKFHRNKIICVFAIHSAISVDFYDVVNRKSKRLSAKEKEWDQAKLSILPNGNFKISPWNNKRWSCALSPVIKVSMRNDLQGIVFEMMIILWEPIQFRVVSSAGKTLKFEWTHKNDIFMNDFIGISFSFIRVYCEFCSLDLYDISDKWKFIEWICFHSMNV